MELLTTPDPPYYAVIFSSIRKGDPLQYQLLSREMSELALEQPGFLGMEHAREDIGITVSYWADLESIRAWREHSRHRFAQRRGRDEFYSDYRIRIALVTREYGLH